MRDKEHRIDSNWKFSHVQLRNFSARKVCQVVQELKSNFNWLVFVHHKNHELEAEQSCKDSIKLGSGWGGALDPGLRVTGPYPVSLGKAWLKQDVALLSS